MFINQQTHQFSYRQGRVRVIELEAVFGGKLAEILTVDIDPAAEDVLQTGRGQKILLTQPQVLAVFTGIVGIQHHRDVLGHVLGTHRFSVIAGIEVTQVEFIGGGGLP